MRCRPHFGFSIATEGKIVYRQGERELISDPGHILFYPRGAAYTWECLSGGTFTLLNFSCADGEELPFSGELESVSVGDPAFFLSLHRAIERLKPEEDHGTRAEAMSLLYRFLSHFVPEAAGDGAYAVARTAIAYINRHFGDS